MAVKKSQIYSTLWAGCDELRGGMDASQYKDYVLVILFVKYVTDKYLGDKDALIEVPEGGSFFDMVALKGSKEIGDGINKIIAKLAAANELTGIIDVADFNDDDKLGKGKEMVDRLTNLISLFENPALNFGKNRADGDDILGDAYEYLMRHFATESGKSKGQFYTPSEVSRILASVAGIKNSKNRNITIYDPTCGSGSLLLKASDEAVGNVTLYGQEKEVATAALAKMNTILHSQPTATIAKGQSTISSPAFLEDDGSLKTFDFVVANPPFSLKNWTSGFEGNPSDDIFGRYTSDLLPPAKNGDYAFLLHIIKSLKSTGKAAVILPHGVLFRGNAEAQIRKYILEQRYIKAVIGLPANLFYGTGIPACIIVLDMEGASSRDSVFMIDASKGFIKDGNKNRLREQDIHKIVDVFNKCLEIEGYSKNVPLSEISSPKNDYNLNIPRYIDAGEEEDRQDIEAHLKGGIPKHDIDGLGEYWQAFGSIKEGLFEDSDRAGYANLKIQKDEIKQFIFSNSEFEAFTRQMGELFGSWRSEAAGYLKNIDVGVRPKQIIHQISEDILARYSNKPLVDKYAVYQHLMDYWNETMQDDCYIIASDGWRADTYRIIVTNKQGKESDKGWTCDLVPPSLVINRYFKPQKEAIEKLESQRESLIAEIDEFVEENSGEDGVFADYDKVTKAAVQKRAKEIKKDKSAADELVLLEEYLSKQEALSELSGAIAKAKTELDAMTLAKYKELSTDDIKTLVVDDKWMASIQKAVNSEMERLSQKLTGRIKELAERYESPLPKLQKEADELERKVAAHLAKMGFAV